MASQGKLAAADIDRAIDHVCQEANRQGTAPGVIRRATAEELQGNKKNASTTTTTIFTSLWRGIVYKSSNDPNDAETEAITGTTATTFVSCFYIAYSTWDGRFLYLDELGCGSLEEDPAVPHLFIAFCKIAHALRCSRFTWQSMRDIRLPQSMPEYQTLKGWLTLHWSREGMLEYTSAQNKAATSALPNYNASSPAELSSIVDNVLSGIGRHSGTTIKLRLAKASDVGRIERLVQGLADYEKEHDVVHVNGEQYLLDGFETDLPLFFCILIECKGSDDKEDTGDGAKNYTCGMAFCYVGFRKEGGRFIYLEDLFIENEYRGRGGGQCVMLALAHLALALDCSRVVWQALDWNTPALTFYNKLGARVQECLATSRYAGESLERVAQVNWKEGSLG